MGQFLLESFHIRSSKTRCYVDPSTAGNERLFQKLIPDAQNREHVTIKDAGHFLQEDKGEELAQIIIDFI